MLYMADYIKTRCDSEEDTNAYMYATAGNISMKEAMRPDHKVEAIKAMSKELLQLVQKKSWRYLRSRADADKSVHQKEESCSIYVL